MRGSTARNKRFSPLLFGLIVDSTEERMVHVFVVFVQYIPLASIPSDTTRCSGVGVASIYRVTP